jgi:hypothetical protein
MTVSRELARYTLDLVGVQVRWEGGSTEPAREYTFLYGKGNENHELGICFFVQKIIISAVKRVEFVSDTMSYIQSRNRDYGHRGSAGLTLRHPSVCKSWH